MGRLSGYDDTESAPQVQPLRDAEKWAPLSAENGDPGVGAAGVARHPRERDASARGGRDRGIERRHALEERGRALDDARPRGLPRRGRAGGEQRERGERGRTGHERTCGGSSAIQFHEPSRIARRRAAPALPADEVEARGRISVQRRRVRPSATLPPETPNDRTRCPAASSTVDAARGPARAARASPGRGSLPRAVARPAARRRWGRGRCRARRARAP